MIIAAHECGHVSAARHVLGANKAWIQRDLDGDGLYLVESDAENGKITPQQLAACLISGILSERILQLGKSKHRKTLRPSNIGEFLSDWWLRDGAGFLNTTYGESDRAYILELIKGKHLTRQGVADAIADFAGDLLTDMVDTDFADVQKHLDTMGHEADDALIFKFFKVH